MSIGNANEQRSTLCSCFLFYSRTSFSLIFLIGFSFLLPLYSFFFEIATVRNKQTATNENAHYINRHQNSLRQANTEILGTRAYIPLVHSFFKKTGRNVQYVPMHVTATSDRRNSTEIQRLLFIRFGCRFGERNTSAHERMSCRETEWELLRARMHTRSRSVSERVRYTQHRPMRAMGWRRVHRQHRLQREHGGPTSSVCIQYYGSLRRENVNGSCALRTVELSQGKAVGQGKRDAMERKGGFTLCIVFRPCLVVSLLNSQTDVKEWFVVLLRWFQMTTVTFDDNSHDETWLLLPLLVLQFFYHILFCLL